MIDLVLLNLLVIAALMLAVWLVSLRLRDVSIVDLIWGMGFVLVAWVSFSSTGSDGVSRWLLPAMTTLWGCRLSFYLAWRNHGQPEDKRYIAMREKRGASFAISSLWIVFGLQGVIMWVVSMPLQAGILNANTGWNWLHFVGIAVFATGFLFESFGDLQLALFKSKPENKGKVLDSGLWRYTRHPNYFGDFMVWWGLYLTCVANGAGYWTVISPLIMSVLLMKVSGAALLERSMKKSHSQYSDYIAKTNAFFPWFPKTSA